MSVLKACGVPYGSTCDICVDSCEPSSVYIIEGWFGSVEWVEGVYASEVDAQAEAIRLWKDRNSDKAPYEWLQGHCKFAVVEHELL